mgnify:CR=1 FL=1
MATPPLDLLCYGLVTHSEDILITGKSQNKKPSGSSVDDKARNMVSRFKYATWNIRGLGEKEEELDKILNENNIKIAVISETKKKLQGTKETQNYIMIYSGVSRFTRGQSGVVILIHKSMAHRIEHYTFWTDRIIEVRLRINRGYLTVIGLYAPNEGKHKLTEEFYEKLQSIFDKVNKNDYILLTGDLNGRVGNNNIKNVVGTNGENTLNSNGQKLIDFCIFNNLKIMNTFFKHKNIHKFTRESGDQRSIIDYIISNKKTSDIIEDVRVYRGANLNTDHYLLCTKINFPPRWLNKKKSSTIKSDTEQFFKVRLLNDKSIRWLYTQRLNFHLNKAGDLNDDIEEEWKILKQILTNAALESLGTIKKYNKNKKCLRIWDEEIKHLITEKKASYKNG